MDGLKCKSKLDNPLTPLPQNVKEQTQKQNAFKKKNLYSDCLEKEHSLSM